MPFVFGLVAAQALAGPLAGADWEVRRSPNDPRVADALLAALLKAPDDRGALRRLLAHVRGAAIAKAAARCEERARGDERLACGHLHHEAGQVDQALASFQSVAKDAPDDPRPHRAAADLLAKRNRSDEALAEYVLALSHVSGAARAPLLETLVATYAVARTPSAEERRGRAAEAAKELLLLRPSDAALKERVAESLARVGAVEPAGRLFAELAATAHDPVRKVPLLMRAAEAAEAAHHDDDARKALDDALTSLPRADSRRREVLEHIVVLERRRERLAALARSWAALPDEKRDASLEALLGQILDELGDGASARGHLERAIKLNPRDLAPRRSLIRLHSRAGDEEAAIAELRRLVTSSHGDPRLSLELAEKVHARPRGEKEALAIAAALGRRHSDGTTHSALAALYEKWGCTELAIAEQTALVRLEPRDPEHLIALGELHDQRGDKDAAKKTWRRIAPTNDAPLPSLLRLAEVLAEHDQAGEALVILERAAHDHPQDAAIERKLADVFDRLRRDEEAETIYRKLLDAAVERDDAQAVQSIGARWLELTTRRGKASKPIASLLAVAEQPKSGARVELALLLARLWARNHRAREAEHLLGRIVAVAPKATDRARALEAQADLVSSRSAQPNSEPITLLLRAAEQDPTRASVYFGKASVRAAELYRDEDALTYAERAVALAPLDADAQERLGSLLEARDPARALVAYDRALDLDAARDRLRLRAAEVALRRGDGASAAQRYRALLARARDEQAIEEASRRAVVVHELTGQLGELERDVAPRATAPANGQGALSGPRPMFRRLLLDIESRYVPVLAARAEAGDADAKRELDRVAGHALAPLLDAVLDGDRDERSSALGLLAQLGSPQAAPLLLRLAAGETARRGGEPPSGELRIAAAQAAIALTPAREIGRVIKLGGDREHKIRLAAALTLARHVREPLAITQLVLMLNDEHARVASAACLALADAPTAAWATSGPVWEKLTTLALDETAPERARACGVPLARRVEQAPDAARPLLGRLAALPHPSPGLTRVLLASEDRVAVAASLARALADAALRGALVGPMDEAPLARPSSFLEPSAWLVRHLIDAERIAGPRTARSVELVTEAAIDQLHSSSAASVLADLAAQRPLLAHLAAGTGEPDAVPRAREALIDRAIPALSELATTAGPGRWLALGLLGERPAGLAALSRALAQPTTRRAALAALADPRAARVGADAAAAFLAPLKSALRATDWRERRSALGCLARHPSLDAALEAERRGLARDPNPLVAEAAIALGR